MLLATCSRNHSPRSPHYLHCLCTSPSLYSSLSRLVASSMIALLSRADTLMAFFHDALTLAHAFGRAFVMLIGCSCKPVCKTYFISTTVVSPDGVYQSGVCCTLLKYSPSSRNHPRHSLCILLEGVWLAEPLDKVVAHCCLVSCSNCTYVALAHHEWHARL
jgi:hypothetical protein